MLNKPVVLLSLMMPSSPVSYLLWISLLLLLAHSAFLQAGRAAVLGWALFAVFWVGQIGHYLEIADYFNAGLFWGRARSASTWPG